MTPTPYTVQRASFTPGATDAHGNPAESWATPVPVAVHGWADPAADTTTTDPNRDAVIRDRDLYAPAGTTSSPGDRWLLPDGTFESVGYGHDYSNGPYGFAAGVVVFLRRVEG